MVNKKIDKECYIIHYSNCLIEAIKQKIRHPKSINIMRKGSLKLLRKRVFPHYYWYDVRDDTYRHFNAKYSDEPFLNQLWFIGEVTEFNIKINT